MLADPCADPRILARVVQARLPENSSNNVFVFFCPQLLQFYSGLSMVYFKEIYTFTRFRGGGVQPIPRGQTFSMGEGAGAGGPNAYSRNP